MSLPKADIIAQLKREVLILTGMKPVGISNGLKDGLAMMHAHFPNHAFPVGAINEFICHQPEDITATTGFVCCVIANCINSKGAIIWIGNQQNTFAPALQKFAIEPHKIIFIKTASEKETWWVTEEALRCNSVRAVVAEMKDLNFTNSRRFQLAVEKTKATGFILNTADKKINTNACVSRWKISSLPSNTADGMPGVGYPRWNAALQKIRNGKPGSWQIEWVNGVLKEVNTQPGFSVQPQRKTG